MSIYDQLLREVSIPGFYKLEQSIRQFEVSNIEESVLETISRPGLLERIKPGETVAITAGSREIPGLIETLKTLSKTLKARGAVPFIVPAMGSHGGATAEGQAGLLRRYGITEESTGMSIRSGMDTVEVGKTAGGIPVRIDRIAAEAGWILPVGRVKSHTDFRGPVESGIMKMLAIGLGKQYGASICHQYGFSSMSRNIIDFARVIIANARVAFGLAILENSAHGVYKIEAIAADKIEEREPELLAEYKTIIPKIPFDPVDVLVISEMGKEISGAGFDPNISGRTAYLDPMPPHPQRIAVLDLTEKSGGNAAGMGNADIICKRLYDKIDFEPVYVNAITCRDTNGSRLPIVMPNDELAVKASIYMCEKIDPSGGTHRIVWIKNTSSLSVMFISEALKDEAIRLDGYKLTGTPRKITFTSGGGLEPLFL